MNEAMLLIAGLDLIIIGLGGAIFKYVLSIQGRLTRIETLIGG